MPPPPHRVPPEPCLIRLLTAALVLLAPLGALADASLDAEEQEFLRLINEYRVSLGLGCLAPSPTLAAAAAAHSQQMGEEGFFSHYGPPCSGDVCTGADAFDRMRAAGNDPGLAGENIFAGQPTAAEALAAWKASPGHDENMRLPGYRAIGIGRAEVPGSPYTYYWTNDFSDHDDSPAGCSYVPGAGGGSAGDDGSFDPGGDQDGESFLGCAAAAGPASLAPWLLLPFLRRSRRRPLEPTWKP